MRVHLAHASTARVHLLYARVERVHLMYTGAARMHLSALKGHGDRAAVPYFCRP